jgi:hypothetical protein
MVMVCSAKTTKSAPLSMRDVALPACSHGTLLCLIANASEHADELP